MMIPQKLSEMDLVLRRDGTVCWVLKDENIGRLRLYGLDLQPYDLLADYNYDFTYGKGINLEKMIDMGEENVLNLDIIAVSGVTSTHRKMFIARNYEKSMITGDIETKNTWFTMFNWVYTGIYWRM